MSGSAITESRGYNAETCHSDDLSFTRHLRPHNPTYDKECKLLLCPYEGCRFLPHISVVRNVDEIPLFSEWKRHEKLEIEFEYSPIVHNNDVYYWLEVRSEFLKGVRAALGFSETDVFTKSPDGKHDFHITLGNLKWKLK